MIKAIIFDFDSTLYNLLNKNKEDPKWVPPGWKSFVKKCLNYSLDAVGCKDKDAFAKKYHLEDMCDYFGIANGMLDEFGTNDPVVEFLDKEYFHISDENAIKFIENDFLKDLHKKYKIFIVSGSAPIHCKSYMQFANIDLNNFDGITCCVRKGEKVSKIGCYKDILKQENLKPNEVIVIGDNMRSDLLPGMELGMHVQQTKELHDIKETIQTIDTYTRIRSKKKENEQMELMP